MPSPDSNSDRLPQQLSIAASALCVAIATTVLVGWQLRSDALKTLGMYSIAMAPATGLLLILGALAAILSHAPFRHWTTTTLARLCGAVVFVCGFLTFIEHAYHVDFGIDRLLFPSALADWTVTPTPGRFSLQASIAFSLIGAALLLLDRKVARIWLSELFAGCSLVLGFFGVVGHVYGVQRLYGVMALHSAVGIAFLSVAVILTRPTRGFTGMFFARNAAGVALRRTLLTTIIGLTLVGWAVLKLEEKLGFSYQAGAAILVLTSAMLVGALLIRTSYKLLAMEREREATRRALFESEAKYRSLFQNTKEGIALYEPVLDESGEPVDWIFRDANPTFLAGVNTDRSALVGHRLTEIFGPPELFGTYFETAREVFHSRKARQFEGFFEPLQRHFIVSLFPIDERLFASTTIDITKSKLSEQQVRESEARYRRIIETANEGIWLLDENMRITFLNDRCAQILGYRLEEMLGRRKFDFVFEEDAAFVQGLFDARRRGQRAHVDIRLRHRNGTERWLMMAAAPVFDSSGQFRGALDMFTDVTDRRAAVQALRESEERFRHLADSMPQMVWTALTDGWMDYGNRRWIEYTGHTPRDAEVWDWTSLVHPNDLPLITEAWRHALRTATEYSAEARMLRKADSTYRWHLIRAIPVLDSSAKVTRWYGTCTDIHENKVAEEAMMKSEKLAATGRLAATIAHEINNPLEAVTNLIFLAQNSGIDQQGRQFLDLASEELQRVAHITKQTLGFYRETAAPARFDVGASIENVLALYERKIESKEIKVLKEIAPRAEVEAIPGEIRQVLSNLISNAIDALDSAGTLHLRVRLVSERPGRPGGVRIVVADNGIGIPAEIQAQVFEPFFTTKRDFGTGLGLWVTRQIMRRHGGNIRVRSCSSGPRRGTVFSGFLPATAAIHEADARSRVARV